MEGQAQFIIKQNEDRFHFVFKIEGDTAEGQSESYTLKESCLNGIESVRKNCISESNFEKRTAKNGQFYFVLKAKNNKIIFTSIMHWSEQARDGGINTLFWFGQNAVIIEL